MLLARDWNPGSALALIQDTAGYGAASVVMSARGAVRMLSRHRTVNDVAYVAYPNGTDGTEPDSDDFAPWVDDSRVDNVVTVTRVGGATVQVSDTDSIARYGQVAGQAIAVPADSDAETTARAQWTLTHTARPAARVDTMLWRPSASRTGALWPVLLPLQFGDRLLVGELPDPDYATTLAAPVSHGVTPLVTGPGSEIDAFVGRVAHAYKAGEWTTTLTLEPAQVDRCAIADHPTYGIADTPQCVAGY